MLVARLYGCDDDGARWRVLDYYDARVCGDWDVWIGWEGVVCLFVDYYFIVLGVIGWYCVGYLIDLVC